MVSEITIKREKRTDEWEKLKVKDLVTFSGGSQPPRDTFIYSEKKGYIRLIQIRDYKTDNFKTYIPKEMAKKTCTEDDVMIGRYGPPIFQILRGIDGAYNVALIKAIPSTKLIKNYLYYFLKQRELFNFIEKLSRRSSGQTGVDLVALNEYPFPLPSLEEQEGIVMVLSDMDDLIESLEKIIEKKKKIKQGTMQQLLTGKKRLPGFDNRWINKSLGEIVNFTNGKAHEKAITEHGEYIVVNSRFISTEGKVIRYSDEKYCPASKEDILMVMSDVPNGRAIAKCFYVKKDNIYTVNQRVCILQSTEVHSKFLYYLLDRNTYFLSFDDGAQQTNLSKVDVLNCPLSIPSQIEEQQAIAEILSDMDAEIEALEEKLEKYKKLKEGMMQELLTGRIRLV